MSDSGFNPALKAKLQKAGGTLRRTVLRPDDLSGALVRAVRQAAAPFEGLFAEAAPEDPTWDGSLVDGKAAMPANRLMAVLEGGGDARALCVLENGVVDALVEVQTTGKVDASPALVRDTTQIDAALTRDFIGLFLSAFAAEMAGQGGVNWPLGLTYGTYLNDTRQLDLLFPDRPYHLLSIKLTLGEGAKSGLLMLMLPVTGADMMQVEDAPSDHAGWSRVWPSIVAEARVDLDAVVMRKTMPLSHLQALDVGDILEFDRADLINLAVSDVSGATVLRARLGCKTGKRALRLMPGRGLPPAIAPPPATAQPPEPAALTPEQVLIEAAMP